MNYTSLFGHLSIWSLQLYTVFTVSLCAFSLRAFCACSCLFSTLLAEYLAASGTTLQAGMYQHTGSLAHYGTEAMLRPAATASPLGTTALALLHTLELSTPGAPTVVHCCAVVTSLFFTVLPCSYVHSSHSDLGGLELSTRTSTSTLPVVGVVQVVLSMCYMGRSMFGVQGEPMAACM